MEFKRKFLSSSRPHILMITNHGIHQWEVVPGLPDTGGQNVFVNQFTESLAKQGFRITIVNRGGYNHPISGEPRVGIHYKDENQRILYLEDDRKAFVRKEDMDEHLLSLAVSLNKHLTEEDLEVDYIISHYWDGAKLGILYNQSLSVPIKHIWVPHSLGLIKKRNVDPSQWGNLRIDDRIENERKIIQSVDAIASTSPIIEQTLREDYQYLQTPLFLPPCVDPDRYHPREVEPDNPIWTFLSQHCALTPEEIQECRIITEISRTDNTKRKDILIKAFSKTTHKHPKTVLVVSIESAEEGLPKTLMNLIKTLGVENKVAVVGSVWNQLPEIYAATDIYCTPSIMEGFGMTSQEAAATSVPVVASHLVPFATEYLLGDQVEEIIPEGSDSSVKIGEGGIVVKADDVNGFAFALDLLLSDSILRSRLGDNAYQITIPYFTWSNVVKEFVRNISI